MMSTPNSSQGLPTVLRANQRPSVVARIQGVQSATSARGTGDAVNAVQVALAWISVW
jgi:hypothetical protein